MNTRAARQIRAGIIAARQAFRRERMERSYDDSTLFGQAYRHTMRSLHRDFPFTTRVRYQ